jgi:S1-C subfamily serine protease
MRIEFEIVTGGRAGFRDAFDKSFIAFGRDPLADVRFDPERDLDVSTKHAAVVLSGAGWAVRDLNSRNGTFVNGQRVESDTVLFDGDVIRCGARGPEVRVRMARAAAEQVMQRVTAPAPPAAPAAHAAPAAPPKPTAGGPAKRPLPPTLHGKGTPPSATSVLRAEVKATRSRVRALLIVLGIVVAGAAVILVWQGLSARRERAETRSVLDSLGRELISLRSAKVAADSEAARLQREIAAAKDPARVAALQAQYTTVQRRQRDIAVAQGVDYRAIVAANAPATAIVFVQFQDTTQMWSGTGFCVSADGTMLTNRHVVVNDQGERPLRIAIQFSGSPEVLPGRLVRTGTDVDIAVIKVDSKGPFPVVAGLATDRAAQEGDPIALVGFPLGVDLPQDGTANQPIVRASLMTGTVSRLLGDSLIQLDAFSGTGASGSPILDRTGRVIGIEFGGQRGSGGRIVYGLPIRRAASLLSQE